MGKGKRSSMRRHMAGGRSSTALPLRQLEMPGQAEVAYAYSCSAFESYVNKPRIKAYQQEGITAAGSIENVAYADDCLAKLMKKVRIRSYDDSRFSVDDMHATYLFKTTKAFCSKRIEDIKQFIKDWRAIDNKLTESDLVTAANSEKGFADYNEEVLDPAWLDDDEQLINRCSEAIAAAYSHIFSRSLLLNTMPHDTAKMYCSNESDLYSIEKQVIFYIGGRFSVELVNLALCLWSYVREDWLYNLSCATAVHKEVLVSKNSAMLIPEYAKAFVGLVTVGLCDESLCKRLYFDAFYNVSQMSSSRDYLIMSHAQFDFLQLFGTDVSYKIAAFESESETVAKLIRNDVNYVKSLRKAYSNFFGYKHNFDLLHYLAPVYGYESSNFKVMTSSAEKDAEMFVDNFERLTESYYVPTDDEDLLDNALDMNNIAMSLAVLNKIKNSSPYNLSDLKEYYDTAIKVLAAEGRALTSNLFVLYMAEFRAADRTNCGASFTLTAVQDLSDKHKRASNAVNKLTDSNVTLEDKIKRLESQVADYKRRGTSDDALKKIADLEKRNSDLGTQNAKYKSRLNSLTDQQNKVHTLEQRLRKAEIELLDARRQIDFIEKAEEAVIENETALSDWEIMQLSKLKVHLVVPDLMSYKELAKLMPKSEFKYTPNDRYVRLTVGTGYDIYFMSTKMTCHGYWWQWLKDLKAVPERRISAYTVGKYTTARLILAKAKELGLLSDHASDISAEKLASALKCGLK